MSDDDLRARVREALERTDILDLATIDEDGGPWCSPVQFQHDEQLNLFFMSMPEARHVANIARDPRVSAAIYLVPGPVGGNIGLQVRGTATALTDGNSNDQWHRFKIEPTEVWCFDSRIDRERHELDVSQLGSSSQ